MTAHQIKQPLSASQVAVFFMTQAFSAQLAMAWVRIGRQRWTARNKSWVNHAELAEANRCWSRCASC
ncbi:hypothetical protein WDV90_04335 [Xanthomonas translucens pv. undulosa]